MGDGCIDGLCSAGAETLPCDDGNVCTDDGCAPLEGCVFQPNEAGCTDGDACSVNDMCSDGDCVPGSLLVCNDDNVCTADSCDALDGCLYAPVEGVCDDGNSCTGADACQDGNCLGGADIDCDDGNDCTTDACKALTGCSNTPNELACDDGNHCTVSDVCSDGACTGSGPQNCDDGNPCTDDSCTPGEGCVYTNNTAPCNDGAECTDNDVCSGGTCTGTQKKVKVYDHMIGADTLLSCSGGNDGFNFLCNHAGYGAFTGNALSGDYQSGSACWAVGEADGKVNELYCCCGSGCTHYAYVECYVCK